MNNSYIVEIFWQMVRNAELSQYLNALKVRFQHQPRNYMEVLQDIAIQLPSMFFDTSQKTYEVSV